MTQGPSPISVTLSAHGQVEFNALYRAFSNYHPNPASDQEFERIGVSVVGLGPSPRLRDHARQPVVVVDADLYGDDQALLNVLATGDGQGGARPAPASASTCAVRCNGSPKCAGYLKHELTERRWCTP
jgi:hypothetical protein